MSGQGISCRWWRIRGVGFGVGAVDAEDVGAIVCAEEASVGSWWTMTCEWSCSSSDVAV